MDKQELKNRTKKFALDCIELTQNLPKISAGNVIGHQLLRSATEPQQTIERLVGRDLKQNLLQKLA